MRQGLRIAFAVFFVGAGVMHFVTPRTYLRIMPSWLPEPLALVYLSGAAEAIFGAMLLVPRLARIGAWGLIATLVAVFPANIQMALDPASYPDIPPALLWLRLPLQPALIAAVWFSTLSRGADLPGLRGRRASARRGSHLGQP